MRAVAFEPMYRYRSYYRGMRHIMSHSLFPINPILWVCERALSLGLGRPHVEEMRWWTKINDNRQDKEFCKRGINMRALCSVQLNARCVHMTYLIIHAFPYLSYRVKWNIHDTPPRTDCWRCTDIIEKKTHNSLWAEQFNAWDRLHLLQCYVPEYSLHQLTFITLFLRICHLCSTRTNTTSYCFSV